MKLASQPLLGRYFVSTERKAMVSTQARNAFVWFSLICAAIAPFIIVTTICSAGPREQVAVAEAWVWACQNGEPALPADTFRAAPPIPLEVDECVADAEFPQNVDLPRILPTPLDDSDILAQSLPPTLHEVEAVERPLPPMAMSFPRETVAVADWMPAQLIVGGWSRGCTHCVRLERDIRLLLTPLGWTIGHDGSCQIRFIELPADVESVPVVTLMKNGRVHKTWKGYTDPSLLSRELRAAWDEAVAEGNQDRLATGSKGYAGTIHAAEHIHRALDWFHDHIGDGVVGELRWDRTGAQSFPLLAKGDWSALAFLGKYGHLKVSAVGAKDLPLEELGFGYNVIGDDIAITIDTITFKRLAKIFDREATTDASGNATFNLSGAEASELGPMGILTAFQVVKAIYSLLHPTCDLILGGNVSATAVLQRDMLHIEFQQMPSIKLIMLFQFNLAVKSVDISTEEVHVEFSGSYWVKERTWRVD